MSKFLLINDFVSSGKIAGNMIDPVLSYMGHEVTFLPTALISNYFSYGNVAIANTNTYLKESLDVFTKSGFYFDVIFIGYVDNSQQLKTIEAYIEGLNPRPMIIFDPIMGDNGKLYKGLDESKIKIYKKLLEICDLAIPNSTEAKFLGLDDFDKLKNDNKNYLITSLNDGDKYYNLSIDNNLNKHYFTKIEGKFIATGDLYDGIFLSYFLENKDMNLSAKLSCQTIKKILEKAKDDNNKGTIIIEKYLKYIDGGEYLA